MKWIYRALLLCNLSLSNLYAEEPQEIRVYLSTNQEVVLDAAYCSKIVLQDASITPAYAKELEAIIRFDLKHNGNFNLLPVSNVCEQILQAKPFKSSSFNAQNVLFAFSISVKEKHLYLTVFDVLKGTAKTLSSSSLSGLLKEDRHQIHRLIDELNQSIYGVSGIANTRILYAVKQEVRGEKTHWVSEIWSCDWDGSNAQPVTQENSYCITPVLIPNHKKFANNRFLYVCYKTGQPKIFISSIGNSKGKRLIDLKGNQLLPAISQQRDKVAFICDAGGRADLFLQEFNPETGLVGKPLQLFSYPRSTQASPTFNRDGSKLAFVSDKDGSPRIYTISTHLIGSKRPSPTLLTKLSRENSCPAWSPDGRKLAYTAKTKGIRQIWIYDFDRNEEIQLTDGAGNKENPAWAPNSQHLVFNSTGEAASELYVVNLTQPEVVKISKGPGIKHYPSWGTR
jgi:TolB protein